MFTGRDHDACRLRFLWNQKVTVQEDQLVHHRFVLETVNGQDVPPGVKAPELSFNEDMHISGSMCNQFTGKGSLSEGVLKAKKVAMTKSCVPTRSLINSTPPSAKCRTMAPVLI